jgi:hypothetical protein
VIRTTFLIEKQKQNQEIFDKKISKFSIKTRQNILASINSFSKFCEEYYEGALQEQCLTVARIPSRDLLISRRVVDKFFFLFFFALNNVNSFSADMRSQE